MAKYIKFNFTDGEDLSIEINDIESVSYIDANTTQIDLNNGVSKFTITHGGALESTAVVEAVYAAMMAQTIGVYSVVKGPISVAQVVDSSSGRQLITTKEKNVTFTSYVFETVPAIEERFVISVKTDNAGGSADNQFIVPTRFGVYNYTIETSDGQTINNVTGDYTITFPTPGTYDILISGDFPWYRGRYSADKDKLIEVKNWGIIAWENFDGAFAGCNNLTVISATDVPDLSNVTNLSSMFYGNNILEINNIENWDVSNVQLFNSMFYQSEVIRNPNIPIDLSGWDMSSATNISSMFQTLQQPTTLTFDLSNWDISNITNMADLFRLGGFDTVKKYDDTLISWSAGNPQSNIVINFGDNQYTLGGAAEAARNTLINTYGWTITDGGGV